MQTSSKVSYDNWSDWNLGDKIMNIRPVGTYCFCHCHNCHHHHHCIDCEFADSCKKCDHCKHHCDCHHCEQEHCYPMPPCPPHHHYHCDCHDPHLFPIDTDGDGFVEGDLIHKVPENYIPNAFSPAGSQKTENREFFLFTRAQLLNMKQASKWDVCLTLRKADIFTQDFKTLPMIRLPQRFATLRAVQPQCSHLQDRRQTFML